MLQNHLSQGRHLSQNQNCPSRTDYCDDCHFQMTVPLILVKNHGHKFLKKLNMQPPYNPILLLLWTCPREKKPYNATKTWNAIVHNSFIFSSPNWKQSKCPLTGEVNGRVNKLWYNHAIEYYSATEGIEVWRYTTTWFNLRKIMLSK